MTEAERHCTLDELMTLESAAKRWPQLFTAIELRRAARAGNLQHIHKGRKRFVTEQSLMEWLYREELGAPCQQISYSKSVANGSPVFREGQTSTAFGTIKEREKFVAEV